MTAAQCNRITDIGPRPSPIWHWNCWWGGWGSNPRPADYENYGPVHRAR